MARTKSEGAVVEKSPSNNSIKTLHLKDRDGAAKQSAMAKAGGHSGFSSLRPYSLVSKMQQESALQIELKEQMLGYKRLRQSHVKQVGGRVQRSGPQGAKGVLVSCPTGVPILK